MKSFFYAARPLVSDFLPTIAFAVLVALKVDMRFATGAALLFGVAQVTIQVLLRRRVEMLQWASLGLVLVFGALGMATHDARFLMVKPSLIYIAIGAVMLRRGWMLRYLPPIAGEHGAPLMIRFGYVWAGLMFATAVANAVVAWKYTALWPVFIAVVPMASKAALFGVQYLTVRHSVIRRMRAQMAAEPAMRQAPALAA